MSHLTRIFISTAAIASALFTMTSCAGVTGTGGADQPKNVIIFIGDGMGLAQVVAASYTRDGMGENANGLFFEQFPVTGYATTHSANSFVTDSAAGGTALATGFKTDNGSLGVDADERPVTSILEIAHAQGLATGLVTSVQINHATPASFRAHVASRRAYDEILNQYFGDPFVQVFLGGGLALEDLTSDAVAESAAQAGYQVLTMDNVTELGSVAAGDRVFGFFDSNDNGHLDYPLERLETPTEEPLLIDLTTAAIEALSADPDGFFLMVEGGAIDWAGHDNSTENNIDEVLEFNRAIEAACGMLEEMGELDDTLIIVTADHETGGLTLPGPYETTLGAGENPATNWAVGSHTGLPVMVWATGPGSLECMGRLDNTDVFRAMQAALSE